MLLIYCFVIKPFCSLREPVFWEFYLTGKGTEARLLLILYLPEAVYKSYFRRVCCVFTSRETGSRAILGTTSQYHLATTLILQSEEERCCNLKIILAKGMSVCCWFFSSPGYQLSDWSKANIPANNIGWFPSQAAFGKRCGGGGHGLLLELIFNITF